MAGYSKRPLVAKLGLKEGVRAAFLDAPDHFVELLGGLPPGVDLREDLRAQRDYIHVFARTASDLRKRLPAIRRRIVDDGMVWVSWPKKTSSLESNLDGGQVRSLGLAAGLVDVKVCAVDDDWSGHKFVVPVADRRR